MQNHSCHKMLQEAMECCIIVTFMLHNSNLLNHLPAGKITFPYRNCVVMTLVFSDLGHVLISVHRALKGACCSLNILGKCTFVFARSHICFCHVILSSKRITHLLLDLLAHLYFFGKCSASIGKIRAQLGSNLTVFDLKMVIN